MKSGTITYTKIETAADAEKWYEDHPNGVFMPPQSIVASICTNDEKCKNIPFFPGVNGKTAEVQLSEWVDSKVAKLEEDPKAEAEKKVKRVVKRKKSTNK